MAQAREERWARQLARDKEENENEKMRKDPEYRGYRHELLDENNMDIDEPH